MPAHRQNVCRQQSPETWLVQERRVVAGFNAATSLKVLRATIVGSLKLRRYNDAGGELTSWFIQRRESLKSFKRVSASMTRSWPHPAKQQRYVPGASIRTSLQTATPIFLRTPLQVRQQFNIPRSLSGGPWGRRRHSHLSKIALRTCPSWLAQNDPLQINSPPNSRRQ